MATVVEGVDYGPLACLIGTWKGDSGMDVAPELDGEEHNPYHEQILFEACGDVTNADLQMLAILRYHQIVTRKSNDEVFHNETGYLTWDVGAKVVTQSFVIPRGVAVVAGGTGEITDNGALIEVSASLDDDSYAITQAPFMRDNASTQSFAHRIDVNGDTMTYKETTVVDIFGKIFDHTDENTLQRV
ncbi:MAG: FABP family protein [Gammaproteobacteria bacterium]|nr:FABP family protein [Gammaproteobacteria bacterium]